MGLYRFEGFVGVSRVVQSFRKATPYLEFRVCLGGGCRVTKKAKGTGCCPKTLNPKLPNPKPRAAEETHRLGRAQHRLPLIFVRLLNYGRFLGPWYNNSAAPCIFRVSIQEPQFIEQSPLWPAMFDVLQMSQNCRGFLISLIIIPHCTVTALKGGMY